MFYLGIDGGGSGCRAALVDAAGTRLAQAEAGPANMATDFDGARNRIEALAREVIGARPLAEVRAVLGLAGANFSGAAARMAEAMPFKARVVQDVATSVRGALGPADGIVAAIGTGSVFARQMAGEVCSIGGWGLRLGDEASGAWIGHRMLQHLTRMIDGYAPPSPFAEALSAELGFGPGIVQFSLSAIPADYGKLAPRVLQAAAEGDATAARVLAEAQDEIRRAITLLQPAKAVPVVWIGGLGAVLALPDWPSLPAQGNALDGAVAMAQDARIWTD